MISPALISMAVMLLIGLGRVAQDIKIRQMNNKNKVYFFICPPVFIVYYFFKLYGMI